MQTRIRLLPAVMLAAGLTALARPLGGQTTDDVRPSLSNGYSPPWPTFKRSRREGAGIRGSGLWRRNAAHGKVRGW